ncbi:MAG TPA: phosphate ABC transporter permease PstA [Microbacteriaceae bacterium]|nr:phosphate ABC transporter permease PstA [Microbacteriaceae bacterium]
MITAIAETPHQAPHRDVRPQAPARLTARTLPYAARPSIVAAATVLGAAAVFVGGASIAGGLALAAVAGTAGVVVASLVVEGRRRATDRMVHALMTAAFVLAVIPLVSLLATVVNKGWASLSWQFITQTGGTAFDPTTLKVLTTAGAWQAVVGTLIITGIAVALSVPIGVLTAIYLVEYANPRGWMARTTTFLVDVMTGIPSIVAGLFAFSLASLLVGPKAFSGFSASVALSVLMIPIVVRSTEEMLRIVPDDLREASLALGATKVVTTLRIVLPTAATGILTGVMLAVSRIVGETAPIFIAASFTDNFSADPFHGPMQTLPVMAYANYKFPGTDIAASYQSAWGAALLLVLLVVALNLAARLTARLVSGARRGRSSARRTPAEASMRDTHP